MKQKHIIIVLFACVLMFSTIVILNTWTQNTLSKDEKRFDLDLNDALSEAEKELMFRVMRLEAARGSQFSENELHQM